MARKPALLQLPAFSNEGELNVVIETPKGDDATVTDSRMLERLRSYATSA